MGKKKDEIKGKDDLSSFISNLPKYDLTAESSKGKQEAEAESIIGMPMAGSSKDKIILITGITRGKEKALEFSLDDVLRIDELPDAERPITKEPVKQVRLWIKDGASFVFYAHGMIDKKEGRKNDIIIKKVFGSAERSLPGSLKFFSCSCVDCSCDTDCTDCRDSCRGNCECDNDYQTTQQAFGFRSLENSGSPWLGNTTVGNAVKNLWLVDFIF